MLRLSRQNIPKHSPTAMLATERNQTDYSRRLYHQYSVSKQFRKNNVLIMSLLMNNVFADMAIGQSNPHVNKATNTTLQLFRVLGTRFKDLLC